MNLQTNIPLNPAANQIDYNSKLILLGSCFSENIGEKLRYFKFQTLENPLGILFHPKAIEQLLFRAVNQELFTENDVFFHNEQWHCFEAHSTLSNNDKNELLKNLNNNLKRTFEYLKEATHIVITFGTSWVYKHNESNIIVANCHKVPQKNFTKQLLSIQEVSDSISQIKNLIAQVNSEATITFTVSPVRHIKDGFVENQQSKAHLISAIHQTKSDYFPSYEIMIDELRDYRFYKADMLHPNQTAIDYIWGKFTSVFMHKNCFPTMKLVSEIQKGLAHKPFNEESQAHVAFRRKLEEKKENLRKIFPFIKF